MKIQINRSSILPTKSLGDFNRALQKQNKRDFISAIRIYKNIYSLYPDVYELALNLGTCYFATNNFKESSDIFHKLHLKYPDNIVVLNNASISYIKAGNLLLAYEFLKKLVIIDPTNRIAWINITSVAYGLSLTEESLYYATQAISLNPTDADLYTNLGASLSNFHRYDEALICYETVLDLRPNDIKALTNIGVNLDMQGFFEESVSVFEKVLPLCKSDNDFVEAKYRMSFPLLGKGDLKRGWEYYENGFSIEGKSGRTPVRLFNKPKWQGQTLTTETLMVWREQGIGDEVWFFSLFNFVAHRVNKIIIECSDRLISLFTRAFPNCLVRASSSEHNDYDFHIPVGSLCNLFANDWSTFSYCKPYLKPREDLIEVFKNKLVTFKNKKLVGISWRSGNLNITRNIHYVPISDWAPILSLEGIQFVNLQYGDCSNELNSIREQLGVDILNFEDVNLKDDLESLAAIIINLDCVISVSSFTSPFSQALGVKTYLIMHNYWTLLGKDHWPWFENVDLFFPNNIKLPISSVFQELKDKLVSFLKIK